MPRKALFLVLALAMLAVPASASALTVSRAQISSGQVRVEGTGAAPGATVTVSSPTSSVSNRADSAGQFRVEGSNFSSADCRVTVSDGGLTASATPTLSGCTVSGSTTTTPPPTTTSPPPPTTTTTCTITPQGPASLPVGALNTYFVTTTGCRTSNKPVKWNLSSGRIPPGMSGPFTQGVSSGGITGRPTTVGSYTFTLQVTDQTGARDSETFTINVTP